MKTINAASASFNDVSVAVGKAVDGDTVTVPATQGAGVRWDSTLTITKCITLQGAGRGTTGGAGGSGAGTVIKSDSDIFHLSPANDLPITISGWGFDFGITSQNRSAILTTQGVSLTKLRITACGFYGGSRTIWLQAFKSYGVMDHCYFRDSDSDVNPYMYGASDNGDESWAAPIEPGTVNTFCVEDCIFTRDNDLQSDPNEVVYGQNGTRICFRHNQIVQTETERACAAFDAHGYQQSWGHGSRFYEFYNNTVTCKYTYRFCYLRGGTHIWHDNEFVCQTSEPTLFSITNEQGSTKDVIKDSFFWNNTMNGKVKDPSIESGSSNPPVKDRDYFTRAIKAGDKWHPYTTLVYPHPLVSSTPTPEPPDPGPVPPAELTYTQWIQKQNDWTKANPPTPDPS